MNLLDDEKHKTQMLNVSSSQHLLQPNMFVKYINDQSR